MTDYEKEATGSQYANLWQHLNENHGLSLTNSEIDDIIHECQKVVNPLAERLVKRYGIVHQIMKIQEECLELSLAINPLRRDSVDADNLYEEIVDVMLMMEQIPFIFDMERIRKLKAEKMLLTEKKYL